MNRAVKRTMAFMLALVIVCASAVGAGRPDN